MEEEKHFSDWKLNAPYDGIPSAKILLAMTNASNKEAAMFKGNDAINEMFPSGLPDTPLDLPDGEGVSQLNDEEFEVLSNASSSFAKVSANLESDKTSPKPSLTENQLISKESTSISDSPDLDDDDLLSGYREEPLLEDINNYHEIYNKAGIKDFPEFLKDKKLFDASPPNLETPEEENHEDTNNPTPLTFVEELYNDIGAVFEDSENEEEGGQRIQDKKERIQKIYSFPTQSEKRTLESTNIKNLHQLLKEQLEAANKEKSILSSKEMSPSEQLKSYKQLFKQQKERTKSILLRLAKNHHLDLSYENTAPGDLIRESHEELKDLEPGVSIDSLTSSQKEKLNTFLNVLEVSDQRNSIKVRELLYLIDMSSALYPKTAEKINQHQTQLDSTFLLFILKTLLNKPVSDDSLQQLVQGFVLGRGSMINSELGKISERVKILNNYTNKLVTAKEDVLKSFWKYQNQTAQVMNEISTMSAKVNSRLEILERNVNISSSLSTNQYNPVASSSIKVDIPRRNRTETPSSLLSSPTTSSDSWYKSNEKVEEIPASMATTSGDYQKPVVPPPTKTQISSPRQHKSREKSPLSYTNKPTPTTNKIPAPKESLQSLNKIPPLNQSSGPSPVLLTSEPLSPSTSVIKVPPKRLLNIKGCYWGTYFIPGLSDSKQLYSVLQKTNPSKSYAEWRFLNAVSQLPISALRILTSYNSIDAFNHYMHQGEGDVIDKQFMVAFTSIYSQTPKPTVVAAELEI